MPACNNTLERETINELPLWKGYDFHHFGLFLAAVFGAVATILSVYLIFQHALHYSKPWEQRHIIRILLLIPVYSIVSFLSYVHYRNANYYDVLEGCYEAFAISAFFTLLCYYVAPNIHDQKDYFRGLKPKNWFWRFNGLQYICGKSFKLALKRQWREAADYGENFGPFRKPRSGLTWFNIIWTGVFQYCVIRVLFTIVAVITQALDVYCEDSLSPAFAHVWVEVFEAVSVTIAMFCLIQFYIQLREDLAEHKPFLKILCIKLVIFFSFWQTILISFLSSANGPLRPTKYVAYQDIKVGIPAVMLCIEMAIFAVMYLFAFPWKVYNLKKNYSDPINVPGTGFSGSSLQYKGGPFGLYALADAFNPWDIIKAIGRGFKFAFVGYKRREQDVSYQRTTNKLSNNTNGVPDGMAGSRLSNLHRSDSEESFDAQRASQQSFAQDTHLKPLDMGDDTAGLLSNQAHMSRTSPQVPEDYHPRSSFDPSPYDDEDTSYHPGFGPGYAPSGPASGAPSAANAAPYRGATASPLHPALRDQHGEEEEEEVVGGGMNAGWNFFAGATRDGAEDDHHDLELDDQRGDLGAPAGYSRVGR